MRLAHINWRNLARRLQPSLRGRLVLLVLAVGIPLLTTLAINTTRQLSFEREHSKEQALAIAHLMETRLNEAISATSQLLLISSKAGNSSGNDGSALPAHPSLQLLQNLKDQLPDYLENVTLWDEQGANRGSLSFDAAQTSTQPTGIGQSQFFKDTLTSASLGIATPIQTLPQPSAVARLGRAIHHDGHAVGVMTADIKLNDLKKILDPQGSLPPGSVITLLDQNGVVIARSIDPEQWIGRSFNAQRWRTGGKIDEGMERVGLDGVTRIGAMVRVTAAPWVLFVGIPRDTALAMSRTRLYDNLALGAVALVIALILAWLLGQSITDPLAQLARDATLIGQGHLNHRSSVQASGELGLLAEKLNQMAQAIDEHTSALQRSEDWLQQMTDNMPALVSYLDRELRFRFANKAYQDWLGIAPAQLLGQSVREFYGEETYAQIAPHLQAALGGARVTYERVLNTPTGKKHVHITLVPQLVPQVAAPSEVGGLYVLITDITDRKLIEIEHGKVQERLSLALEGSKLALFDWDMRTQRVYFSPMWAVMCGAPAQEIIQTPEQLLALVHPEDLAALNAVLIATLKDQRDNYDVEHRIRMLNGEWLWIRSRGRVVERDANGRAVRIAGTNVDINIRKQTERHLKYLAEVDMLTQLPNRACFTERLAEALQRAAARQSALALLFLDVDYFKQINDQLGHETGDRVLQEVALRLNNLVRSTDTVARLGGDEFTVILNDLRSVTDAENLTRKLLDAIREPIHLAHDELRVTVSIGIAYRARQDWDGTTLLRNADQALYEVKARGRNGYFVYTGGVPPELKLAS